MPITPTVIPKATFTSLMSNITTQYSKFFDASAAAYSGLQIIVDVDQVTPEVDLLDAFYHHYQGIDSFVSISNWVQVVSSLNGHIVNRGTVAQVGETPADRFNRWLSDNTTTVTQTYANISSGAGYIISNSNIV